MSTRRASAHRALGWTLALLAVLVGALAGGPARAGLLRVPTRADEARSWTGPLPVGLRRHVLAIALEAYECGRLEGHFDKALLTLIDYSRPSDERRLWVIDLDTGIVLFHEFVAHGRGSGDRYAVLFSNTPESHRSSLGLFRTANTYVGGNGYSLNLMGLEPGVNDRAFERRIVVHGAEYVRPEVALAQGRVGRTWGCPALDPRVHRAVIDRIKDGSALFIYYPDRRWLTRSHFLACGRRGPDHAYGWPRR